jgi:hypothetical protein
MTKQGMTAPREVICSALEQILETMYFCQATWIGPGRLDAPAIGSGVRISGTLCGQFRVIATTRLATQLAADFVAADTADITASQAMEIIHEFANVACGATLGAWMPDANFNFSAPFSLSQSEVIDQWSNRFFVSGSEVELAVDLVLTAP